MTLFRSTSPDTITFDVGDTRYTVPPGGLVEIERRHSYIPSARGLPLREIERREAGDEDVAEGKDAPPPVRRRVKGVASGDTVLNTDDADDRAGAPISDARAALLAMQASDDGDGEPSAEGVPALVSRRKGR